MKREVEEILRDILINKLFRLRAFINSLELYSVDKQRLNAALFEVYDMMDIVSKYITEKNCEDYKNGKHAGSGTDKT